MTRVPDRAVAMITNRKLLADLEHVEHQGLFTEAVQFRLRHSDNSIKKFGQLGRNRAIRLL